MKLEKQSFYWFRQHEKNFNFWSSSFRRKWRFNQTLRLVGINNLLTNHWISFWRKILIILVHIKVFNQFQISLTFFFRSWPLCQISKSSLNILNNKISFRRYMIIKLINSYLQLNIITLSGSKRPRIKLINYLLISRSRKSLTMGVHLLSLFF